MRLLIFGATGRTGKQIIDQGLSQKHIITSFVRNPKKIQIKNNNLIVIRGNIFNKRHVKKAIENQDAVVFLLGNKTSSTVFKPTPVITIGLKTIIQSMKECKVKRLVFVSSFGVSQNIFFPEKLFIKIFLKNIFKGIPDQESMVEKSGLDWTIIRPARLTNGAGKKSYRTGADLKIGLFSRISRRDVAHYILKIIMDKSSYYKLITQSY